MPWVDAPPTEIVRDACPPDPAAVRRAARRARSSSASSTRSAPSDMLLFSTDYPHWQFDGDDVLPDGLPERIVRKILIDNPLADLSAPRASVMAGRSMNVTGPGSWPSRPLARDASPALACRLRHPSDPVSTAAELDPFLSERWRSSSREYRRAFRARAFASTAIYPRMSPRAAASRMDALAAGRRPARLRPAVHARSIARSVRASRTACCSRWSAAPASATSSSAPRCAPPSTSGSSASWCDPGAAAERLAVQIDVEHDRRRRSPRSSGAPAIRVSSRC